MRRLGGGFGARGELVDPGSDVAEPGTREVDGAGDPVDGEAAPREQTNVILGMDAGEDVPEEWGAILGDEVMAAALLDRLRRHCHIVNIRGNSYRMRKRGELAQALHQAPAREPRPGPR